MWTGSKRSERLAFNFSTKFIVEDKYPPSSTQNFSALFLLSCADLRSWPNSFTSEGYWVCLQNATNTKVLLDPILSVHIDCCMITILIMSSVYSLQHCHLDRTHVLTAKSQCHLLTCSLMHTRSFASWACAQDNEWDSWMEYLEKTLLFLQRRFYLQNWI